jgi:hypothetical protein
MYPESFLFFCLLAGVSDFAEIVTPHLGHRKPSFVLVMREPHLSQNSMLIHAVVSKE